MEHKSVQRYYILLNKTNKKEKKLQDKVLRLRTTEDSDGGGGKPRFKGH